MGTNYYWTDDSDAVPFDEEDKLHIGKASVGWHFLLNTHPEAGIETLEDWKYRWSRGDIHDEYGLSIEPEVLLKTIVERRGNPDGNEWSAWEYEKNNAEPGLNHLVRPKIDGRHCIAHGDGTYDLMRGEFS